MALGKHQWATKQQQAVKRNTPIGAGIAFMFFRSILQRIPDIVLIAWLHFPEQPEVFILCRGATRKYLSRMPHHLLSQQTQLHRPFQSDSGTDSFLRTVVVLFA